VDGLASALPVAQPIRILPVLNPIADLAQTPEFLAEWQTLHRRLTESSSAAAQRAATILEPALDSATPRLSEGDDPLSALPERVILSPFLGHYTASQPQGLVELADSGDLQRSYPAGHQRQIAEGLLADTPDEPTAMRRLRQHRYRELARIAWRDLGGRADTDETLRELSELATGLIRAAAGWAEAAVRVRHGQPRDAAGEPMQWVVAGLGKLGGDELNFSSDIDLVFAYPEDGETDGPRPLSNLQFFTRLGQRMIRLLDERTEDGFVYRVDMRLRPWGDSGPLAIGFDALETYCQLHGREWERYAWIKARPLVGTERDCEAFVERLRPFVYRRYLDFSAFESLREMKGWIQQQVERKGFHENLKLGRGGIREVEFIAQGFQLIRGGRERALRARGTRRVVTALAERGLLPDYVTEELLSAYTFLRRAENRLQMLRDRQEHQLPSDPLDRIRLARAMGYSDWTTFYAALQQHRQRVREHFEQVFNAPQRDSDTDPQSERLQRLWQQPQDVDEASAALIAADYGDEAETARVALERLRDSGQYLNLSRQASDRLDRFIPMLIAAAGTQEHPGLALERALRLVRAVAQRSVYLALLIEHPMALSQLVKLCGVSPWIADQLSRHPILLDELLDPRTLYAPPDRVGLEAELAEGLTQADGDLEQQMNRLRQFQQRNTLRIAAADIVGVLPLMRVSDHLTQLAEVVLATVVELAREQTKVRHGQPRGAAGQGEPRLAAVAYGKLGGFELGYGSDLDLVFLHDGSGGTTDGPKPVDNGVFFARQAQRILHMLGARTEAGILYEVDTRLRPNGPSGLLVSTLEAFAQYQREAAWTWEHQALVRTRHIAGNPALGERFAAVRAELLAQPRDRQALAQAVAAMRARQLQELAPRSGFEVSLKHARGGIGDIEFLVQYAVLGWAHEIPALTHYPDNIRLLQTLADKALLPRTEAELLIDAYRAYRARGHRLALQGQPMTVPEDTFRELRAGITRIWNRWFEADAPMPSS